MGPARFPKLARLHRAGEFQKLKREGASFHGNFIVLSFVHVPQSPMRFGLITSRRVGPAVIRNRVRRRLREIVRADRARIVAEGWCVLVARARAADASFHQMREDWRALARRARLLRASE
ncbi:MAG TPA: ribonuclease P protein component [Chthoniobacteraceae bacterium]|nr:ribonuclease P protein component [Chthoniobacteraceae bacterium]